MAKPKLLILSDLFGGQHPEWINYYTDTLRSKFEIQYYDVLELASIDASNLVEADIHKQFLDGGIDKAVETLLKLETDKVTVLGFSIGGTIAWKASLLGLKTMYLFAVSSTRLRYETEAPNCEIKLYFGENDPNKPHDKWFIDLKISNTIHQGQGHDFYKKEENTSLISKEI